MSELICDCSGLVDIAQPLGFWLMRIGVDLHEERSLGVEGEWAVEIACASNRVCEAGRMDRAVAVSGAWSRGLLIAEAVRAGLANSELKLEDGRRLRRIEGRFRGSCWASS